MRVLGVALVSGLVLLGACGGGGETPATDTATPAAPVTPAPTGTAAYAAPVGTIHEVRMVGDAAGFRYEPANITVKPGDGIKFINVSGGPHNVAFDPATIPADQKDQLFANMPNSMDGSSPLFGLSALREIDVTGAITTSAEIARLRKALPQATVHSR